MFAYSANAQSVTNAEYFFDSDPGFGNGTPITITPADSIIINNLPISTSGLALGYHCLYMRVKDSVGSWSFHKSIRYYIYDSSPITPINDSVYLVQAEYFVDATPSPGNGTLINLPHQDTVNYLSPFVGFPVDTNCHSISLMVKDNLGNWSHPKYGINSPVAQFDSYVSGYDVILVNNSYNHQATHWDFNDGDTSDQFSPVHHYDSAGVYNVCLTESNNCQPTPSIVCKAITVKGVNTISPTSGGNIGFVTMTITGAGFTNNTTIKLVRQGETDILPLDSSMVITNGNLIKAVFNLIGKTIGEWNVIVSTLNDTSFNIAKGFKIEYGKYPIPVVKLMGNHLIRVNRTQNYVLKISNTGNVDAIGTMVWFAIPSNIQVKILTNINVPGDSTISYDTIPQYIHTDTLFNEIGSYNLYGYVISKIAANSSFNIEFSIKVPSSQSFGIKYWTRNRPIMLIDTIQLQKTRTDESCFADPDLVACLSGIANKILGPLLIPIGNCFLNALLFSFNIVNDACGMPNVSSSVNNIVWRATEWAEACITLPIPKSKKIILALEILKKLWNGYQEGSFLLACTGGVDEAIGANNIFPVSSFDPNHKFGNSGVQNSKYINSSQAINYSLFFENVDTATAAAQTVILTDTLDYTNLDLSTLQLTSFGFSDTIISIPPGKKSYTTDIDLQPNLPLIARVTAYLNDSTHVLTAKYESLDPLTMKPTEDALLGFLLPNDSTGRGEGFISYSIKAKDSIATGAVINNMATIYFDENAPINTPVWTNFIDDLKPQSQVDSLSTNGIDSIFVHWSGVDNGPANVYAYNVYYNKNGGEWTLWKYNSTLTNDVFIGENDTTYGFYSVAIDSATNVESAPSVADKTITISTPLPIVIKNFFLNEYNCSAFLSWTTSQESNTSHIDIYRTSNSANTFPRIATVQSAGQSNQEKMYSYIDKDVKDNTSYEYQLQFIDIDGRVSKSDSKTITLDCSNASSSIHVFPNPAKNELNVLYVTESNNSEIELAVYDLTGRNIISKTQSLNNGGNLITLDISKLSNGIYFLHYKDIDSMESGSVKFEKK